MALCLWLVVSCSDVASATVLLPADFVDVVTGSSVIVHGRVAQVVSTLAGPRRSIESFITLDVIESWRGTPGPTVVFRVPNGQVGRYRRILVGAPEFEQGDEVVVFLQARAPAIPTLFGLSQGVYRVVHDANARALVTPPPVMARGVAAERVVRGDPARQPLPIDAFAREVRLVLHPILHTPRDGGPVERTR
jgi:hypothetical protein